MLFVIISSLFSISLTKEVKAEEQKACCQRTTAGDYCQYTEVSNCDPVYDKAYTSCENTEYCQVGCCYDSNEGRCHKNVAKAVCEATANSTWNSNSNCDIAQCQKGCCILGTECSFVTQTRCKKETSKYPEVTMQFKEDITSEPECVAECRNKEEGCCVLPGGQCKFTTRDACEVRIQTNDTGFFKDTLCSNDKLNCDCAKMQYTACLGEDVYWFDSCGNRENIYNSDKRAAYNNGYILDESESCKISGPESTTCGNCDYSAGTLCGKAADDVKMEYGEYTCNSLDCEKTYEYDAAPSSGTSKKHGESWCVYDAAVGFGMDVVGSRHYRHICINGEEMTEPCKDYREELCIQGIIGEEPLPTEEAFEAVGDYVEAACRDNRWKDCSDCTDQKCCESLYARDCYWLGGVCIPHVPPGLRFWDTTSKGSKSTQGSASSVCEKGNQECTVVWIESGMHRVGLFGSYECVQNCQCIESDWVKAGNTYCKSLGDCGAYFNIAGEISMDGFTSSAEQETDDGDHELYELTESDVGDWSVISKPTKDAKEGEIPGAMAMYWKALAPGLMTATISGVATILASQQFGLVGKEIGKQFSAGFFSGGRGLGALISPEKSMAHAAAETGMSGGITAIEKTSAVFLSDLEGKTILSGSKLQIVGDFPTQSAIDGALGKGAATVEGGSITLTKDFSATGLQQNLQQANLADKVAVVEGKTVTGTATSGLGTLLQWVNTIMWIYTIYSLIDTFFREEITQTYTIECNPWVAPEGGDNCELCNEEGKTCSEYRCKSLGQLCSLINQGSANETCINLHPNDVNSPIIEPWPEKLQKGYTLTEMTEQGHRGYKLNEKIEPFTPVTIAIKTDEPAQCKISTENSLDYDKMPSQWFGSSLYLYEHEVTFALPSELATEQALDLTNGGKYTVYVRCKDGSGNANENDYFIKFEIKPGPDLTPPVIELTSINNGIYVPYEINSTALKIYTNEPATCKWSTKDTAYYTMENEFTCVDSGFDVSSLYYGLYECNTVLTGMQDKQDNNFYFRCKDKPTAEESERNVNEQSYKFTLKGTIPLYVLGISPSGVLYYNDPVLEATTVDGAENGIATCGYSEEDVPVASTITFVNTSSTSHSQPFKNMQAGTYTYYIKCIDVAGNIAEGSTTFTIAEETSTPKLTLLYKDINTRILHIELNEPTNCEYSSTSFFGFGTGTKMTGIDSTAHEASLDSNVYFIICQDLYGNEMSLVKIYT